MKSNIAESSCMINDTDHVWKHLAPFPFQTINQFMIGPYSTNAILALPEQTMRFTDWEREIQENGITFTEREIQQTGDGIYVFSNGSWFKLEQYPSCLLLNCHSAAFDYKNKVIYIITGQQMIRYQCTDSTLGFQIMIDDLEYDEFFTHMCCVKGQLHIIRNNKYYTYDQKNNKMKQQHQFTELRSSRDWIGAQGNGLIHSKHNNVLVIFERRNNNIIKHECAIDSIKWTQKHVNANSKIIDDILYALHWDPTNDVITASVASTTNGDYIIFINGQSGKIYVLDSMQQTIANSNVDLCFDGTCSLAVTRDEYADKLIISGWIRECTNLIKELDAVKLQIPVTIHNIISCFVCNEKLHVVEFILGYHFSISVDIIIQSIIKPELN